MRTNGGAAHRARTKVRTRWPLDSATCWAFSSCLGSRISMHSALPAPRPESRRPIPISSSFFLARSTGISYQFAICRRKNGGFPRFHTITEPIFQQASTNSATHQSGCQVRLEAASTRFCRSCAPFAARSLFIVLVRDCLSGRRERGSAVRAVRVLPPGFSLLLE
jgi:hypothetical protein